MTAWHDLSMYAYLSTGIIQQLAVARDQSRSRQLLPNNIWSVEPSNLKEDETLTLPPRLNVNFPFAHPGCENITDFKYVQTRFENPSTREGKANAMCKGKPMPLEERVWKERQCYVSITVGSVNLKKRKQRNWDAPQDKKEEVGRLLERILDCLPEEKPVDTIWGEGGGN